MGRRRDKIWRILLAGLCLLLSACQSPDPTSTLTHLERVQLSGELHVLTVPGPTTYYTDSQGNHGFEYHLAESFSKYLGVSLKVTNIESFASLEQQLAINNADLAVGTYADKSENLNYGPVYQTLSLQVLHKINKPALRNFSQPQFPVDVQRNSKAARLLQTLKASHPSLILAEHDSLTTGQLIDMLWNETISYTVADSNTIKIMQRYYPELRVSQNLISDMPLAWSFPPGDDNTLTDAAHAFFNKIENDGYFDELVNRYFGYIGNFDYVEIKRFQKKIKNSFPDYYNYFLDASRQSGIDWRLLAAIGYQESHWNPKAKSPTGVRGMMMLTQRTMKHLGITESRLNPEASIKGGAIYYAQLKRQLPPQIQEPDRSWFALAAYNIGAGHLEDARRLTEQAGKNPDKWVMVKEHLPLLTMEKWYKKTRYGHARGKEAVQFVENIRNYYDVITWISQREQIIARNSETSPE